MSARQLKAFAVIGLLLLVGGIAALMFKRNDEGTRRYEQIMREVREQYPLESLEERLPDPSRVKAVGRLSRAAEEQLLNFERSIENEGSLREERRE